MAEVQDAPAAEPEVQQASSHAPVEETYDESLLIKVKGKVKRPERPDDTEKNLKIAKLKEEIDKASARIAEIKSILDNKMGGGRGATPEQQAIRDRRQQLRNQFSELVLQKKRLQSKRDDHQTEREKALTESRSLRDSVRGPINLQQLEEKIADLEFKLTHESLSPQDEKRMREQKDRLEKNDRPSAQRYAQLQAKIDAEKAAVAEVRAQIAALDTQLDAIKKAQEAEDGKLDAIRARQDEQRSDIPGLQVEKKDLWDVIQALRQKQTEIRTEFDGQWDEFKKRNEAWKAWAAIDRRKRDEQRKKEYEERQAARKAREVTHKPAKYEQEVFLCEQVISYLKQFVAADGGSKAAAKEVVEAPEPGMKLLKKKEEEEFMVTSVKKGKGARKAAEKDKAVDSKAKKLHHTLETLSTFLKLGVTRPETVADVPACLEAVTAKKAEYEALKEKAATEPEPEEEAAAEEEAKEEGEAAAAAADEKEEEEAEAKEEDKASSSKAEANGNAAPEANGHAKEDKEDGAVGVDLSVDDKGKVRVSLTM